MGISVVKGWRGGAVQWDEHIPIVLTSTSHTCHPNCVGIYVGVSGGIVAVDQHGNSATYVAAPVGILQGRFSEVTKDAATDADSMIELVFTGKR